MMLMREALWNVAPFSPANLLAAWSFAWTLRRDEVVAAFEHRLEQIAAAGQASDFAIADIDHKNEMPAHVAERWRLNQARLEGEAVWTRATLERLRRGEYWFQGEPDPPLGTVAYGESD